MWTARAAWLALAALTAPLAAACSIRLDPTRVIQGQDAGRDPDAGASRPCSALESAGSRYWICARPVLSYAEARAACQALSAELVNVSSPEENSRIVQWASELETETNLWIGATRDDAHVWRWPDGSVFWQGLIDGAAPPSVYSNWQMGEPNNASTVAEEAERCAALALFDSGWRDRACSIELSYVCEAAAGAP